MRSTITALCLIANALIAGCAPTKEAYLDTELLIHQETPMPSGAEPSQTNKAHIGDKQDKQDIILVGNPWTTLIGGHVPLGPQFGELIEVLDSMNPFRFALTPQVINQLINQTPMDIFTQVFGGYRHVPPLSKLWFNTASD